MLTDHVYHVCDASRGGHDEAHMQLTSSTFCIHSKAGGCEIARALLGFGLPSCPRVNQHAITV